MKKIMTWLAIAGALLFGCGAGEFDRVIHWDNLLEVKSAFEQAFEVHLTEAPNADLQKEFDAKCAEMHGPGVRYLGFSFETGNVCLRPLDTTLAPRVCESLQMELGKVDVEKQELVCTVSKRKQA